VVLDLVSMVTVVYLVLLVELEVITFSSITLHIYSYFYLFIDRGIPGAAGNPGLPGFRGPPGNSVSA